MSAAEIKGVASRWIDAFNKKDLDGLLCLYDEQAEHYSPKLKIRHPETRGLIKGKATLRQWWQDAFERLPSLHYRLLRLTAEDNRVFMEYLRQVAGEEDLYVGEMLELNNGLIVASSVFHR
ncbi:MAG: nuclear transport factor 2 family protein [Cyclobacteriaceae bacterium]|nr:nuclear transport factor 2 family protein [Cyclobacteriaceae bacterium]